jgi:hypothetical protein
MGCQLSTVATGMTAEKQLQFRENIKANGPGI